MTGWCAGKGCEVAHTCAWFNANATRAQLCQFGANPIGPAVQWVPVQMVRRG